MTELTDIVLSPLVPPALLWILSGGLLALTIVSVARRARGAWVRLLPGAILLAALANPQWMVERREPLNDVAVIAVDESFSNGLSDRPERTHAALEHLQAVLETQPRLDVRVVPVPDGGANQGTRLMGAVTRALADVPPGRRAGVIALTDGRVHDAGVASAANLDAPFHVLLTGARDERDRRLVVDAAPGYGLVGRSVKTTVRLEDPALPGGTPVPVAVTRDGQPDGTITLPANRRETVALPLEHAGDNVFELSAEAAPDELTPVNNGAALTVNGVRDRLRVLLISGEPHAGERVWRNLLKADPNVDLVHFTILRPPHKDDATPLRELALIAFPIRELFEEQLQNFDLIIFDRYSRRGLVPLHYLTNVADYVREGGALLLAAGPEFNDPISLYDSALADVLPVSLPRTAIERPFIPHPTADGRRHPVTAALPGLTDGPGGAPSWGPWARLIEVQPTGGRTLLAGAADRPLLLLSRSGEGRVGLLLSDSAWLWAKGFEGGGPQAELLRRTAHWLMKEPELEEDALRGRMVGDRLEITRRGMDPAAMPDSVTVTGPRGAETTLPLLDQGDGRALATLTADAPGVYTITDGTLTTVAVAGTPNPLETAAVTATDEPLRALAEGTGGGVTWLSEDGMPAVRRVLESQSASGSGWIGLRDNRAFRVQGVDQTSLMPVWLALLTILGGLGWAWWREGR
ncbi:hypothetical protein F1188_02595 [Roseospira marina]|uniref:Glutamine amidotransferase domain-containing protein n=1 Tax=Roseospira marina TaxID=140057 RepID=A0A5M6IH94_9PROT|nr:hypothetical protein [Roseospira marina]KAA5607663.1 hypothetical protein F1188_02595 [Roseospira marina]MBB4312134.1 hypothetical protein [Roseospira marina]MBB5085850.1 hypothetical protein [Roseospira marina]